MDTKKVNTSTGQSQLPAADGQFNQYPVYQGYGTAPYAQGAMGYCPNMPMMAWVPLKDKQVFIPVNMLYRMEANLTQIANCTQTNNVKVALSALQSAVYTFLQFEKAFKSFLSKGDDYTCLHNIKKCINELKQANAPQKDASTHELSWLVTYEDPFITNTRELFEHCIKVLKEIAPLLGGRRVQTYKHEKIAQAYGWTGWQQQSRQIEVSNRALGSLLEGFLEKNPDNSTYKEINCFYLSVTYILSGFFKTEYPKPEVIRGIYANNNITFLKDKETMTLQGIVVHKANNVDKHPDDNNIEESNVDSDSDVEPNNTSGGFLSGWFSGQ